MSYSCYSLQEQSVLRDLQSKLHQAEQKVLQLDLANRYVTLTTLTIRTPVILYHIARKFGGYFNLTLVSCTQDSSVYMVPYSMHACARNTFPRAHNPLGHPHSTKFIYPKA